MSNSSTQAAAAAPAADPRAHRGTIHLEDATVLAHDHLAGEQHIIRVESPVIAAHALPGQFVHLRCDEGLPMRRPMSIMRSGGEAGWLDVLYKAHGTGTALLARRQVGEQLSTLGPIGQPFKLEGYRRRPLLLGGGVGIPPMIYLAEHMVKTGANCAPLVLMASEVPFPFTAKPAQIIVDTMPPGTIACMPMLDDWGVANRLASQQGYPGCYQGLITDLARHWLDEMPESERDAIEIYACGPTPMLKAVQALAAEYALPAWLSLEEYMACAVGGCAGCTVPVHLDGKVAMKRVCVDGPVFDAESVFPA